MTSIRFQLMVVGLVGVLGTNAHRRVVQQHIRDTEAAVIQLPLMVGALALEHLPSHRVVTYKLALKVSSIFLLPTFKHWHNDLKIFVFMWHKTQANKTKSNDLIKLCKGNKQKPLTCSEFDTEEDDKKNLELIKLCKRNSNERLL